MVGLRRGAEEEGAFNGKLAACSRREGLHEWRRLRERRYWPDPIVSLSKAYGE